MVNGDITDSASASCIPVVFLARLIFLQRCYVLMVAHESEFKLFAQCNGIRQRGATDNEATLFYRWQIFERLDLTQECISVFLGYLRFKPEENYSLGMLVDMGCSQRYNRRRKIY